MKKAFERTFCVHDGWTPRPLLLVTPVDAEGTTSCQTGILPTSGVIPTAPKNSASINPINLYVLHSRVPTTFSYY